jgi:flagellar M-ring protein FliF
MEARTMGFLKQTFLQVQEHLKGLSLSHRVSIALCVGLIAVSLAWLMHWSVTPDMVNLLDQSFSPQELSTATRALSSKRASYKVSGDRILVPADERDLRLAQLQESEALPSDMRIGFAKLMESQSIFVSYDDAQWQRQVALGNELARVLRKFTDVRGASVFIDRPVKRGFGENRSEPKASVFLEMRPNASVNRGFVDAVASFVSGSVVGMRPESVSIVDATTGQRYEATNKDSAISADFLDDRRKKEEHYTQKIRDHLSYIRGVLVGVFAELETEARRTEERKLGNPLQLEEETTTNTERAASPDSEPGVMPNAAAKVPAGNTGTTRDLTTEKARYAKGDEKVIVSENMRGVIKRLTASINVPRSYFVNVFRQVNGADKNPTEQELEQVISVQLPLIKAQVRPLIDASTEEQVQVSWFPDPAPVTDVALASSSSLGEMAATYGRPAVLAGLAVLSLAMMLMLVRKAQPAALRMEPVLAGAGGGHGAGGGLSGGLGGGRRAPEDLLAVEGGPVGKAQVTQTILEGREVDEKTLKNQQIIEQVNDLVKDDPDSVASMLRKWIEEPH